MKRNIYCQIKDLEILIIRFLFTKSKNKLRPPTYTQARIMDYIIEHKNQDVYQKELEKKLNLRRATVSEVLATMEKKGLIKRERNPYDARSKKIILSEPKDKENKEIKNNIKKIEDIITENISEEELLAFSLTLKKMQENLKNKYNNQGGKNV